MIDLRSRLDDLVAGVPAHVAGDARQAWRTGTRRRWRRRIVSTAAALLALTAIAVAVPRPQLLQPADGDTSPGYPQRIGHTWSAPLLPSRPGHVVGLLTEDTIHWYAVSAHADLWKLPSAVPFNVFPSLSHDGRYIGYYFGTSTGPSDDGSSDWYVIRDVTTGRDTRFPGRPIEEQSPVFWSPDNRRLVSLAAPLDGSGPAAAILGVDGSVTRVPPPAEGLTIAGWSDDTTLVWVNERGAVLSDVDGQVRSRITFVSPVPLTNSAGQHTAAVAADTVIYRDREAGALTYHAFRLSDGQEAYAPVRSSDAEMCPVTVQGSRPILGSGDGRRLTALTGLDGEPAVVIDPALDAQCVYLTDDALSGEPHGGVFGRTQTAWTWWWREILAGLGAIALLGLAVGWTRSRRRRRRPAVPRRGFGMRGWIGAPPWVRR